MQSKANKQTNMSSWDCGPCGVVRAGVLVNGNFHNLLDVHEVILCADLNDSSWPC